MNVQVQNKVIQQIHETSILQQTSFWSDVKRYHGIGSKAFDIKARASDIYAAREDEKIIVDDVLILLQSIGDDYQIGYVPYGPTLKPSEEKQGVFLEELSESLRSFLPSNCILIRYDLLWESPWAKDDAYFNDRGDWLGPPKKINQEIRLNFDTQKWNLKKANTNILPADTVFIDLKKDEQQLLKAMKPKTRYNVRLSRRKGVEVRRASFSELDIWYELYKQTCERNRIFLHDIAYFRAVFEANNNNTDPTEAEMLIAEIDDQPLAAMFLAFSGERSTYLYGASSSTHRNLMGTYALQWEAIRRAKKHGCAKYDMFGVAPKPDPAHPMYGLYRFKTGFGGQLFHRMSCWDYPLDLSKYEIYRTSEMTSQGYRLN